MKSITVYYPTNGAFICWEPAVQIELSKLPEDERRTCQVVVVPECMRKRTKRDKQMQLAGMKGIS